MSIVLLFFSDNAADLYSSAQGFISIFKDSNTAIILGFSLSISSAFVVGIKKKYEKKRRPTKRVLVKRQANYHMKSEARKQRNSSKHRNIVI